MILRDIAHARAGDKGRTSNIAVFARRPEDYPLLVEVLTSDRVKAFFGDRVRGPVTRYEVPSLHALNFVLEEALEGGVTRSLALDAHGKSLSSMVLGLIL